MHHISTRVEVLPERVYPKPIPVKPMALGSKGTFEAISNSSRASKYRFVYDFTVLFMMFRVVPTKQSKPGNLTPHSIVSSFSNHDSQSRKVDK